MRGIVAIVGRPNVGKSTLFNRLTRTKQAIVGDMPGVTRDRLYGSADLGEGQGCMIIDTGGFEKDELSFQPFGENIVWKQTQMAVREADLVVFLLDGKTGMHPHDTEIFQFLREADKQILFVVNKIDSPEEKHAVWDFCELGVDDFYAVSAVQKMGLRDLRALMAEKLQGQGKKVNWTEKGIRLALIGRPNVGKSSILNRLLGEERSLVSPIAGTTRDSIHTTLTYNGKPYVIIDTAGIRRKARIHDTLEEQSVVRSLSAIEKADIVLLVIDAELGLTDQDLRLINLSIDRGRAVLLVVNKWDLLPAKSANTIRDVETSLRRQLGDLAYIPIHFISCLENQRVHKILARVEELSQQFMLKFPEEDLQAALETITNQRSPDVKGTSRKPVLFFSLRQAPQTPPKFVLTCTRAKHIKESYRRFISNGLRRQLGLTQVPMELVLKSKRLARNRP
ncbi:MAG: ribosome biogenesis GTPase Der [Deltaproteobacteria bacterium]|nr:ribosome biogenesis GTPase Der [Deltaproteobacteria bacterium]